MLMVLSATVILVDLFVAVMQVTVSVAIMQLEVSAVYMQVKVSAVNMQVTDNFYLNYAGGSLCCCFLQCIMHMTVPILIMQLFLL